MNVKEKLEGRFAVLPDPSECPKCHSIQAALYVNHDTIRAMCLKCGTDYAVPRFRPGDQNVKRLQAWAMSVKARDEYTCRICGRPGDMYPLHAHHIIPKNHDPNGRFWYATNNGLTLCKQCHELVHGEWMRKYDKER